MKVYKYKRLAAGGVCSGFMMLQDPQLAIQQLSGDGGFLIELKRWKSEKVGWTRIKSGELADWTWRLSEMIETSTSLPDALLGMMEEERSKSMAMMNAHLCQGIVNGEKFSVLLTRYRQTFPHWYTTAVDAAEQSGNLATVLRTLSQLLQTQSEIQKKTRSAMAYPLTLLTVGIAIFYGILTGVIPQLESLLIARGADIDTHFIYALSRLVRSMNPLDWLLVAGGGAVLWMGRSTAKKLLMRIGIFKAYSKELDFGLAAGILQTLCQSKVEIIAGLNLVAGCMKDPASGAQLRSSSTFLAQGWPIADCLKAQSLIPPDWARMVAVAQDLNGLTEVFGRLAQMHRSRAQARIESLHKLLEPLLVLAFGSLIGGALLSAYMPIINVGFSF